MSDQDTLQESPRGMSREDALRRIERAVGVVPEARKEMNVSPRELAIMQIEASQKRGFVEAITDVDAGDVAGVAAVAAAPFSIPAAAVIAGIGSAKTGYDSYALWRAGDRLSRGVQTEEDEALLKRTMAESMQESTIPGMVGDILRELPQMAGAFAPGQAAGRAVVKGAKKAAQEALEGATGNLIVDAARKAMHGSVAKVLANKGVQSGSAALLGAAASTVLTVGDGMASGVRMAWPGLDFREGEAEDLAVILQGELPRFIDTIPAGVLNQFIEYASESAGAGIAAAAASKPARRAISMAKAQAAQVAILRRWVAKTGASPGRATEFLKTVGIHGMVTEVMEERLADVARAATGLGGWEDVIPEAEQLVAEVAAFGMIGAAGGALDKAFPAPNVPRGTQEGPEAGRAAPRGEQSADVASGRPSDAMTLEGLQRARAERGAGEPAVEPVEGGAPQGSPAADPMEQGPGDVTPETAESVAPPAPRLSPEARANVQRVLDLSVENGDLTPEEASAARVVPPQTTAERRIAALAEQSGAEYVVLDAGKPLAAQGRYNAGTIVVDRNQTEPEKFEAVAYHELWHMVEERAGKDAERAAEAIRKYAPGLIEQHFKAYQDRRKAAGLPPAPDRVETSEGIGEIVEQMPGLLRLALEQPRELRAVLEADRTFAEWLLDAVGGMLQRIGVQIDSSIMRRLQRLDADVNASVFGDRLPPETAARLASALGDAIGALRGVARAMDRQAVMTGRTEPSSGLRSLSDVVGGSEGLREEDLSPTPEPGELTPEEQAEVEKETEEILNRPDRAEELVKEAREGDKEVRDEPEAPTAKPEGPAKVRDEAPAGERPAPQAPHGGDKRERIRKGKRAEFPALLGDPTAAFANALLRIARGNRPPFKNIVEARKFAADHWLGGVRASDLAEGELAKKLDETIERGAVLAARDLMRDRYTSPAEKFEQLVKLYRGMPKLNVRTSASKEMQAFSTPLPLSYAVSRATRAAGAGSVLEPTAGNGSMLVEMLDGEMRNVEANELDETRLAFLASLGLDPSQHDAASTLNSREGGYKVILANPPFGNVQGRKNIDHLIARKAMERMAPDGRAALIIGGLREEKQYRTKVEAVRFYKWLWQNYNVVRHVQVDGKLYDRQGASWPVDVILIDGVGQSDLPLPGVSPPKVIKSWKGVWNELGERSMEPGGGGPGTRSGQAPDGDGAGVGGVSEPAAGSAGEADGGGSGGRPGDGGAAAGGAQKPGGDAGPAVGADLPDPDGGGVAGTGRAGTEPGGRSGPSLKPGRVDPGRPSGRLSDTEIDDALDDVLGELEGKAPRKPKPSTESPKDIADGLRDVFGDKLSVRERQRPEGFETDRYEKAKPHFIAAGRHVGLKDPKEFFRSLVTFLRDVAGMTVAEIKAMRVYLSEFAKDVNDGIIRLDTSEAKPKRTPPKGRSADVAETELQTPYEGRSESANAVGTLVPRNMADALRKTFDKLEQRVGKVDAFVAESLGMEESTLASRFSKEQVDAIALAIDNINKGAALVIADQTGVGKGRVVAAAQEYARQQGKVPVFMTAKPELYVDMVRDLQAIGAKKFKPFVTNTNLRSSRALSKGGVRLESADGKTYAEVIKNLREGRLTHGYTHVFTTYDQTNYTKNQPYPRHHALDGIAEHAFLVLDESHKAGGTEQVGWVGKGENREPKRRRSDFVRGLVDKAAGVMYSSATYAKNPYVMTLYRRTNMRLAFDNPNDITGAMKAGGTPLQQAVSVNLVEDGQLTRREKSWDGIDFKKKVAKADREQADIASSLVRGLFLLDKDYMQDVRQAYIDTELVKDGDVGSAQGVGNEGADSTTFSSVLHNLVSQTMLSMKADSAAREAVAEWEAGSKPVIVLKHTMGSMLSDYAEMKGIKTGDSMAGLDLIEVYRRYLEKQLRITVKGEGRHVQIPLEWFAQNFPRAHRRYVELEKEIGDSGLELTASPIDRMLRLMRSAGMKVDEITGRQMIVEGETTLARRRKSAKIHNDTIVSFQNGGLDAVILNESAAEGVSLHNSKDPKESTDNRRRVMFVLQAHDNIDVFMQLLGRINRTGQHDDPNLLPRYWLLVTDLPAEQRPAAILMKRMASLNANTTADTKGQVDIEALDFLNPLGDKVAAEVLQDEREVVDLLDIDLFGKDGALENVAAKATGRLVVLPVAEQERILDAISDAFRERVDYLTAIGQNPFRAEALDLDARTIDRKVLRESNHPTSTSRFAEPSYLEKVDVKRVVRPLSMDQIRTAAVKSMGVETPQEAQRVVKERRDEYMAFVRDERARQIEALEAETKDRIRDVTKAAEKVIANAEGEKAKELRTKLEKAIKGLRDREKKGIAAINNAAHSIETAIGFHWIGAYVNVRTDPAQPGTQALVTNFERKGRTKDPLARSDWQITLYTTESPAALKVSLSTLRSWDLDRGDGAEFLAELEEGSKDTREERYIATGNLLASYGELGDSAQSIILYTDSEGNQRQGVLMRRKFDGDAHLEERPVVLKRKQAVEFIQVAPVGATVESQDGILAITKGQHGYVMVADTRRGKPYYLHQGVREIVGNFTQRRGSGPWSVKVPTQELLLKAMAAYESTLYTTWQAPEHRSLARTIAEGGKDPDGPGGGGDTLSVREAALDRVDQIRERVDELRVPTEVAPETYVDSLVRFWQDKLRPLKQLQRGLGGARGVRESLDAYEREERRKGITQDKLHRIHRRGVAKRMAAVVEKARGAGISYDDLGLAAIARHAPERNRVIEERTNGEVDDGSGMTTLRAEGLMIGVEESPHRAIYDEFFEVFDQINRMTRKLWVRYGLTTQEHVKALEKLYKHYAPLRTDLSEEEGGVAGMRIGRGVDVRGREYYRALGRKTMADDPIAFSLVQLEQAVVRGEKARVGQVFLRMARRYEEDLADVLTIGPKQSRRALVPDKDGVLRVQSVYDPRFKVRDEVLAVKEGGQEVLIEFKKDYAQIAKALKNLGPQQQGWLTDHVRGLTRRLAALSTRWNPAFTPFNFVRDIGGAFVTVTGERGIAAGTRLVRSVLSGGPWSALMRYYKNPDAPPKTRWDAVVRDFFRHGGAQTFLDLQDLKGQQQRMVQVVQSAGTTGGFKRVGAAGRAVQEFMENINDAVENMTRVAAFDAARESLGWSNSKSASYAVNITTNFMRKGEVGDMLNAWYMFSNASIQGTARVAQAMRHRGVRRLVAGAVAGAVLLDVINRTLGGEDDDGERFYDKIPDYIKRNNLVVMDWIGQDGDYITIPVPFVYNWFHSLGTNIGATALGPKSVGDGVMDVALAALDAFNPLGGAADPIDVAMPTIMDPFIQHARNKDWAGRDIRPENLPWGVQKPDSQLYWPSVSPALRGVTEWLNSATGGDEFKPGLVDVSPETIEHFTQFITGGLGKTVTRTSNVIERAVTGEPIEDYMVPIWRRFKGSPWEGHYIKRFRETRDAIEQARARVQGLSRKGKAQEAQDAADEDARLLELRPAMRAVERELERLDKMLDLPGVDKEGVEARRRQVLVNFNRMALERIKGE